MIHTENPSEKLGPISNLLATPEHLSTTGSQLDGLTTELETSVRFIGCCLTQKAGILLRLPQDIIAQAIVTFTRFYTGADGGSFRVNAGKVSQSGCRLPWEVLMPSITFRTYQ